MGSWIVLLLAQTILMATGRPALHKQLGIAAFVLAPVLIVVGFMLVPAMRLPVANAILHGPPAVAANLRPIFEIMLNIVLVQIRIGVLFAVLVTLGLTARRTDSELHKRLMILATAAPLPAALDRMQWLPSTIPGGPLTIDLYPLAVLAPMFLWDLYRLKKVHKAYLIYLGLDLALAIPLNCSGGTPCGAPRHCSCWASADLGAFRAVRDTSPPPLSYTAFAMAGSAHVVPLALFRLTRLSATICATRLEGRDPATFATFRPCQSRPSRSWEHHGDHPFLAHRPVRAGPDDPDDHSAARLGELDHRADRLVRRRRRQLFERARAGAISALAWAALGMLRLWLGGGLI